jgi:asparagine synthase (glutamine-hydrolysing)
MCGITGIAAFNQKPDPTYDQLKAMCNTIVHRGPDAAGMNIRNGVALGMRRLSIIDVEGGGQPIYNEDRSIRTVYNGEIYNYKELRQELEGKGHVFSTRTDTEVVVHAYEEYGTGFPREFNGMFAFALHDSRKNLLFLVRDHLGIKPLYYSFDGDYLVWGSEIKAILASGRIERRLDVDALGQFLAWEYVPGESTLFKSIKQLEPAAMLRVDLDRPTCNPSSYWNIPLDGQTQSKTDAEWEELIDHTIQQSVQRQLISDVPLGAFLSGGVDSSLVVNSMGRAKTFSIGFDDPSYNELNWARKVATHLGAQHIDDIIKPDILSLFDRLMYHMDDPIGDFSIFPTFLVSQHARKYVTVALSGDGGDELFGGYETYVAEEKAKQYARIPSFLRNYWIKQPESLAHARWRIFAGEILRNRIFTPEALSELMTPAYEHIQKLFYACREMSQINRCLYVDLKSYLTDNCMVKVDRMSMAASLEARVPLLDKKLVELAFLIPDEFKVAHGKTKILLKRIAARHVPADCVYRPKEGFSIPIKNWLICELRPLMEDLLDSKKLRENGLFEANFVEKLKQEHLNGTANNSHVLWSLMVFQAWHDKWLTQCDLKIGQTSLSN